MLLYKVGLHKSRGENTRRNRCFYRVILKNLQNAAAIMPKARICVSYRRYKNDSGHTNTTRKCLVVTYFHINLLKPERVWLSGLLGLKSQEKYRKLGGHRSRHTGIPLGPSEKFV